MNKKTTTELKDDPELVTTWHGQINPVTGKRPVTYQLGTRADSPMFTSLDDLRKKKREIKIDPYRDSPLPNIFDTPRSKTPTMDEIMPKLQNMKEGWGENRSLSTQNVSVPVDDELLSRPRSKTPTMDEIIPRMNNLREGWEFPKQKKGGKVKYTRRRLKRRKIRKSKKTKKYRKTRSKRKTLKK
jgi:hypothetical protein